MTRRILREGSTGVVEKRQRNTCAVAVVTSLLSSTHSIVVFFLRALRDVEALFQGRHAARTLRPRTGNQAESHRSRPKLRHPAFQRQRNRIAASFIAPVAPLDLVVLEIGMLRSNSNADEWD